MGDLVTPIQIAGMLAGSVLTVWALVTKVYPMLKRCWIRMFYASEEKINARLDIVLESLEGINQEIRPRNGEGSVREVLNWIKSRQQISDAFQKASLNIYTDAVFKTDEKGACTFSNRRHQNLTGFSFPQIKNHGWLNIIAPEERKWVEETWQRCMEQEREFSEDLTYIKPDQKTRYKVHVSAYKIEDSDNQIHGYFGVVIPLEEL